MPSSDPARKRADISSRWFALRDAQRWDRRRTEQWQQLGPPISFQGPKQGQTKGQKGVVTEAFKGEIYLKVDSKARVSIPAAMRHILELADPADKDRTRPRVVMIYGAGGNHAQCYSMQGAQALYDTIYSHPVGSSERDDLETAFVARSHDVDIDEDGRIVLPPRIRQRMGVTPDDMAKGFTAVFVGKLDRFELWKAETYDAQTPDLGSISADIRKKLPLPKP